ncbi:MAG: hypothetical protein K0S09_2875 [Sphingobacteriaceae bacterium]|jgi:hypothetical protein|nr:hypothetical protein [Sphingobacteriaceae bacterium]
MYLYMRLVMYKNKVSRVLEHRIAVDYGAKTPG